MTPAEEFAKLNNLWHEVIESHDFGYEGYTKCSCGRKDCHKFNPIFSDAKSILEVMMKRKDWNLFSTCIGSAWYDGCGYTNKIEIGYILNPDKLLTAAIEWCREHKEAANE